MENKIHKFGEKVLYLYLFFLFVVMPLYSKGGYHMISTTKWALFCNVSYGYQFGYFFLYQVF